MGIFFKGITESSVRSNNDLIKKFKSNPETVPVFLEEGTYYCVRSDVDTYMDLSNIFSVSEALENIGKSNGITASSIVVLEEGNVEDTKINVKGGNKLHMYCNIVRSCLSESTHVDKSNVGGIKEWITYCNNLINSFKYSIKEIERGGRDLAVGNLTEVLTAYNTYTYICNRHKCQEINKDLDRAFREARSGATEDKKFSKEFLIDKMEDLISVAERHLDRLRDTLDGLIG